VCPTLVRERLAGARAYVMVDDIRGGAASGPIVYSNLARSGYFLPAIQQQNYQWELLDLRHRCPIFPRCGFLTASVAANLWANGLES